MSRLGFVENIRGSHHIYKKARRRRESLFTTTPWHGQEVSNTPAQSHILQIRSLGLADLKYEIIIYWSDQDGHYIAEVPDLPGCMADGDTLEDTLAMAQEVMQLWIDTTKEDGSPVPTPKGRRLIFA
jgi:predicted RNase H-like HicB family nuclease/predicted RNA binding protein YcfA (HicA-like mRNA interferase family)